MASNSSSSVSQRSANGQLGQKQAMPFFTFVVTRPACGMVPLKVERFNRHLPVQRSTTAFSVPKLAPTPSEFWESFERDLNVFKEHRIKCLPGSWSIASLKQYSLTNSQEFSEVALHAFKPKPRPPPKPTPPWIWFGGLMLGYDICSLFVGLPDAPVPPRFRYTRNQRRAYAAKKKRESQKEFKPFVPPPFVKRVVPAKEPVRPPPPPPSVAQQKPNKPLSRNERSFVTVSHRQVRTQQYALRDEARRSHRCYLRAQDAARKLIPPVSKPSVLIPRTSERADLSVKLFKLFARLKPIWEFGIHWDLTDRASVTQLVERYIHHITNVRSWKSNVINKDRQLAGWIGAQESQGTARSLAVHFGAIYGSPECKYVRDLERLSVSPRQREEFYAKEQALFDDQWDSSEVAVTTAFIASLAATAGLLFHWSLQKVTSKLVAKVDDYHHQISVATSRVERQAMITAQETVQETQRMVDGVLQHMEILRNTAATTMALSANDLMMKANDVVEVVDDHLTDAFGPLKQFWKKCNEYWSAWFDKTILGINLPKLFIMALRAFFITVIFRFIISVALPSLVSLLTTFLLSVLPMPIVSLTQRFMSMFSASEEPKPQGKFSFRLGDIFNGLWSSLPDPPKGWMPRDGWGDRIPRFSNMVKAIEYLTSIVWKLLVWSYSFITGQPIPTNPLEVELCNIIKEFDEYRTQFLSYDKSWASVFRKFPRFVMSIPAFAKRAQVAHEQMLRDKSTSAMVSRSFTECLKHVLDCKASAEIFVRTASERPCTLWINLCGPPNSGKSYYSTYLCRTIPKAMYHITKDEKYNLPVTSDTFHIPKGEIYFDKWDGQVVMSQDDIFQSTETDERREMALFLFTLVSTCPCPLLVADMENKCKLCTSEFFISTSNQSYWDDLGVTNPQALRDRCALNLLVIMLDKDDNEVNDPELCVRRVFRLAKGCYRRLNEIIPQLKLVDAQGNETSELTEQQLPKLAAELFLAMKSHDSFNFPEYDPDQHLCWSLRSTRFKYKSETFPVAVSPPSPVSFVDTGAGVFMPAQEMSSPPVVDENGIPFGVVPGSRPAHRHGQGSLLAQPTIRLAKGSVFGRLVEEEEYDSDDEEISPSSLPKPQTLREGVMPAYCESLVRLRVRLDDDIHKAFLAYSELSFLEALQRQNVGLLVLLTPYYRLAPFDLVKDGLREMEFHTHPDRKHDNLTPRAMFLRLLHSSYVGNELADLRSYVKAGGAKYAIPFGIEETVTWLTSGFIGRQPTRAMGHSFEAHPGDPMAVHHLRGTQPGEWPCPTGPTTVEECDYQFKMVSIGVFMRTVSIFVVTYFTVKLVFSSIKKLFKMLFGRKMEPSEQSGLPSASAEARAMSKPHVHVTRSVKKVVHQPTAQSTSFLHSQTMETLPGVESKIFNNIFYASFAGHRNFCLGLFGSTFVVCAHTVRHMGPGMIIQLNPDAFGSLVDIQWDDCEVFSFSGDLSGPLCFISHKLFVGKFQDIRTFFFNTSPTRGEALRMRPTKDARQKWALVELERTASFQHLESPITACDWRISSMSNADGYCGLPYVAEVGGKKGVFAIHGAGFPEDKISFAHSISSDDVENVFKAVGGEPSAQSRFTGEQDDFPPLRIDLQQGQMHIPGTHPLGKLERPYSLLQHSSLVLTPQHPRGKDLSDDGGSMHLQYHPTRRPAVLSPSAEHPFPAAMPLNKFGVIKGKPNLSPPIDPDLYAGMPYEHLLPPAFKEPERLLTYEEAIRGREGFPALDLTPSPGYPYVTEGKRRSDVLFQDGQIRPEFLQQCARLENRLETAVVPTLACMQQKDELLPYEDVKNGKLRLFNIVELVHVILCICIFAPLQKAVQTSPWFTPISIGIDPHSMWGMFHDRLRRCGILACAGDFSGHEFTLPAEFVQLFILFCNMVHPLSERWTRIRANLIYSVCHPIYVFTNCVFTTMKGQGSGSLLTAFFASFCTWCFHVLAARNLGWKDYEIKERLEMGFVGDDSVVTVSPDFPEFNMRYLSEFAPSLGMVYTSATKGEVVLPFVSLYELEYLKRKFVIFSDRLVLAPLRISSIYESLMYEQKGATIEDRRNTWTSALLELRHHSPAQYNEILRLAERYFRILGTTFVAPTYQIAFQRLSRDSV